MLAGERRSSEIVRFVGDPVIEFANHGSRVDTVTDDFMPPRMGYIAVRHGLAVPHVVASFRGVLGAKTAANVATATLSVLGRFNANANAFRVLRLGRFIDDGARVSAEQERPKLTTTEGEQARALELLTPTVRSELHDLTESFAVEIRDEWVLAYSYFGDVTTTDPEVWAWVFSSASRLIDLVALWREGWPPVDAGVPTRALDLREIPFYTSRRLPHPSRLDGVLSRSALDRLRR